jgi:hypothetical protein
MNIRALMNPRTYAPSDATTAPPAPPPAPPEPEKVYTADYVRRLRNEAETLRQETAAAKADADAAKTAAEGRVAELTTAANVRIVRAELRAEAIRAGIVDLDGLALLDPEKSGVKLADDGSVTGAAEALAALKQAKPYLFGTPANTGNTQAPKPGEQKPKRATEMTAAEYAAARAAVTGRR